MDKTAWPPLIWLASRSPRRRQFLTEAGWSHVAEHPGFEDSDLGSGHGPASEWVASLAYLKAAAGAAMASKCRADTVLALGADTTCVHEGKMLGTPRSGDEAREMLKGFRDGWHEVQTGVALLLVQPGFWTLRPERSIFVSGARVEWGSVSDEQIEQYVQSRGWEGKAGGYNLRERVEAGWPIRCQGDPTCVMGLPMGALRAKIRMLESAWSAPESRHPVARANGGGA
ncbi:MAG: Maf family protein [Phycisphaerales bacterium]